MTQGKFRVLVQFSFFFFLLISTPLSNFFTSFFLTTFNSEVRHFFVIMILEELIFSTEQLACGLSASPSLTEGDHEFKLGVTMELAANKSPSVLFKLPTTSSNSKISLSKIILLSEVR